MQRIFFFNWITSPVFMEQHECDLEKKQKKCKNGMCCAHVLHPYCSSYILALIMCWTIPTKMVVHSQLTSVLSMVCQREHIWQGNHPQMIVWTLSGGKRLFLVAVVIRGDGGGVYLVKWSRHLHTDITLFFFFFIQAGEKLARSKHPFTICSSCHGQTAKTTFTLNL